MIRYETPILTSVAYPPTVGFVPVEIFAANITLNMVLLAVSLVVAETPPVIWVVTTILLHGVCIGFTVREAHLVSLMQSIGRFRRSTRNIVPAEGVKYVP